jgi:hypothetical protein
MIDPQKMWPQWLVNAVCDAYQSGVAFNEIALVLMRPEGSVRSKLVREGVYISKTAKRQTVKAEAQEGF